MSDREWSLRSALSATVVIVAAFALSVSGILVGLTTLLHRTTAAAAASVESVRLAQEAEIDLLLHDRTTDAAVRRHLEESAGNRLLEARQYARSEHERSLLAQAESRVAAYTTGVAGPAVRAEDIAARQGAAYESLEALVTFNVAHARDARATAAAWDERAKYASIGVAILLLVGAAGLLFWLRRRAFAAVFALAAAMDRFGKGDREARAEQTGPAELREMSSRFNEMAASLATQRRAQIAWLGGVAHDLRNPLAVLETSIATFSHEESFTSEGRVRQLIERMARQLRRLERMADDFIEIAKIESGEIDLKLEMHDARELVREVVGFFDGTLPEPRFLVLLPDTPLELYCDRHRLEQVLTNLVSNAIKYSAPGSVIELAAEAGADDIGLRVTDHGIGIPEPERRRIFDPFRRTGLSKETVPGVGLGLFVVRQIVQAHGGHVDVESTPGAGSTFRVRLPRTRTQSGHGHKESAERAP